MGITDREAEVDEVLSSVGTGLHQLSTLGASGFAYASAGWLAVILASVSRAWVEQLSLHQAYGGAVVSLFFVGYVVGNLVGGLCADSCGRRPPQLWAYLGKGLCQLAVPLAGAAVLGRQPWLLVLSGLLLGCFLGLGKAGASAGLTECCAPAVRGRVFGLLFLFTICGQISAAVLLYILEPDLNPNKMPWRTALLVGGGLILLGLVIAWLVLRESARWYLARGDLQKAEEELQVIASRNGRAPRTASLLSCTADPHTESRKDLEEASPLLASASESLWQRIGNLFTPELRRVTLVMCWANFTANSCYYGVIYGMPHTLSTTLARSGGAAERQPSAALWLVLMAAAELPGLFGELWLVQRVTRVTNMAGGFVLTAACLGVLSVATLYQAGPLLLAGALGTKACALGTFCATYLLLAEIYPTRCRATGIGVCMCLGRFGGFVCPSLYEIAVYRGEEGLARFYLGLVAASALAALLCTLLPRGC